MLSWPAGPAGTDGVWAPAWYERGRALDRLRRPAAARAQPLPDDLQRVADAAQPHFQGASRPTDSVEARYFLLGSSTGFTYVRAKGPMRSTCTTAPDFVHA